MMKVKSERLIHERFEGVTEYQTNDDQPIEHPTHWCFSLKETFEALKNQRNYFEKEIGAKVLSQKIIREAMFELGLVEVITVEK